MANSKTGPFAGRLIKATMLLGVVALTGCTTSKERLLDTKNAPTMVEIYKNHLGRAGDPYFSEASGEGVARGVRIAPFRKRKAEEAALIDASVARYQDLVSYSRTEQSAVDNLFPTIPNPVLKMYVYPHVSGVEGVPIPGYTTAFPLYRTVHFALPGEVPTPLTDASRGDGNNDSALTASKRSVIKTSLSN